MKLKYLGTAGSEGVPSMFCGCENCSEARILGGRNIRTRSQAIVDEHILIDFPCDTFLHVINNNIDMQGIEACLITHIHPDHMYPMDMRPDKNYGKSLSVFGSSDIKKLLEAIPWQYHKYLDYKEIKPFEPFEVGDYSVTALAANHRTDNPYIYIISDGQKSILYAHDSGPLPKESLEYLKNSGVYFSLISLDCHWGDEEDKTTGGHACLGVAKQMRRWFLENKLADSNTKFVLNHFSHNGTDVMYDEFVKIAAEYDFLVSYDGMEIEI